MLTLTFAAFDYKLGTVTHIVERVELSNGEQNIPNGFRLVARCGRTDEDYSLRLERTVGPDEVPCSKCKEQAL